MPDADPQTDADPTEGPWEPRSRSDRIAAAVYRTLVPHWRAVLVLLAALLLLGQFLILPLLFVRAPVLTVLVGASVVPALLIFWYIRRIDDRPEPLGTLAVTFLLAALFAGFAAAVNTIAGRVFDLVPVFGTVLLHFLVAGPGEELVKWAAIRLYAFDRPEFDTAIDGAIYGAAAGLGFATIENVTYIGQNAFVAVDQGLPVFSAALPVTFGRSLGGPGHVLYSALAGYYLGVAKFEPGGYGPLAVKGLLLAALLHAVYNSLVVLVPLAADAGLVSDGVFSVLSVLGVPVWTAAVLVFVVRTLRRHQRRAAERDPDSPTAGPQL